MTTRAKMLTQLSQRILDLKLDHPTRVGIDGMDASGKTTLADELADYLGDSDRQIIRASIDGFHHPRAYRYQKGRLSPEGYYADSFNYVQVQDILLNPLGSTGNRLYQTAIFDYRTDSEIKTPVQQAEKNALLLMDGVFLFRPELVEHWDVRIWVDVDFEISLQRAMQRAIQHDPTWQNRQAELIEQYEKRYIPGQKLYFEVAQPREHAHVSVDNRDLANPRLI